MSTDDLIARIRTALDADPRVRGAFLAGSHGRGTADRFSDVDVLVVVAPDEHAAFLADWSTISDGIGPTVYRQQLGRAPIVNHITPEWLRYDVTVVTTDELTGYSRSLLRPLVDRAGLTDPLPATGEPAAPDPRRITALTTEFLRVLGLLPVVIGREEYVCAASGAALLRTMLIDLMRADVAVEDPGGVLHLARLLPAERYAALAALPPIEATRDGAIAAHRACAAEFLPLARAIADRIGAGYPDALETACLDHLRAELAVTLR